MKKIFVYFAVLVAMIFMISCGGGSSSNNDSVANFGKLGSECYPNETCDKGLLCDTTSNLCVEDPENPIHDSDKTDSGSESNSNSEVSDTGDSQTGTEPADSKEIHVSECTGLPENAQWNTVSEITQRWDGSSWQPPKEGSYNETPSTSECRFECKSGYIWNNEECMKDVCDLDFSTLPECSESSGTPCKDSSTGVTWSKRTTSSMLWSVAVSYCGKCGDGGWRLPNINELRTLIIHCAGTMPGGSCAVKDPDCLSSECYKYDDCSCEYTEGGFFSKLGDTNWFWSSSVQSDNSDHIWYVGFGNGEVNGDIKPGNGLVRCVR